MFGLDRGGRQRRVGQHCGRPPCPTRTPHRNLQAHVRILFFEVCVRETWRVGTRHDPYSPSSLGCDGVFTRGDEGGPTSSVGPPSSFPTAPTRRYPPCRDDRGPSAQIACCCASSCSAPLS